MTPQQYFVIPAKERVKKSKGPHYLSSFPRKRESRGGAHKIRLRLYCGTARLDSRFRGNDEVLLPSYCLSPRRIFGAPVVICESLSISSHARKRESRGGARKSVRRLYCGAAGLDSRFRGNDEVLSAGYRPSLPRLFGVAAVTCEGCRISSHALARE